MPGKRLRVVVCSRSNLWDHSNDNALSHKDDSLWCGCEQALIRDLALWSYDNEFIGVVVHVSQNSNLPVTVLTFAWLAATKTGSRAIYQMQPH